MGAGALNLVINNGESDKYFTGNPKITFFKTIYRQHTNFGLETVRQDFTKIPYFGNEVSLKISRNGDLINKMYLVIELPKIKQTQTTNIGTNSLYCGWINHLVHIINYIDIKIGGKTIERLYPQWLDIYSEIFLTIDKQKSYNYLTLKSETIKLPEESGKKKQVIMIPLTFWFFNSGNALPLMCLHYHDVTIHTEFKKAKQIIKSNETIDNPVDINNNPLEIIDAYINVDYIFLDKQERSKLLQNPYETLITQTQFTGIRTIPPNTLNYRYIIDHKYNVKEFFIMFQPISNVTEDSKDGNLFSNYNYYHDPINFKSEILNEIELLISAKPKHHVVNSKHYHGVNNFNYHTNSPNDYIYSYSFALNPEEEQPSGTINLTETDSIIYNFKLNSVPDFVNVYLFSRNYNILRIDHGMGGVAFYE